MIRLNKTGYVAKAILLLSTKNYLPSNLCDLILHCVVYRTGWTMLYAAMLFVGAVAAYLLLFPFLKWIDGLYTSVALSLSFVAWSAVLYFYLEHLFTESRHRPKSRMLSNLEAIRSSIKDKYCPLITYTDED